MKETEFNKWYNSYLSQLPKDNCIFNHDAKLGWNACRDRILEILKRNTYGVECYDMDEDDYVDEKIIKEVEKL